MSADYNDKLAEVTEKWGLAMTRAGQRAAHRIGLPLSSRQSVR